MESPLRGFDNRQQPSMPDQLSVLLERIRELVHGESRTEEPPLSELEHTLTDGYAQALVLERERWRLKQRIDALAGEVESESEAAELRRLAAKLEDADVELGRLRGLLDALRLRVDHTRGRSAARRARS
jgi:hypothetical protein